MNSLITNINEFGIKYVNTNNQNNQNSNIIYFANKSFQTNILNQTINFISLSKHFPEYIIKDIANKLSVQLISSDGKIISNNWIVPLDKKFIILYLLQIYCKELDKINLELVEKTPQTSKPKNPKPKTNKSKYKKKSIPIALKRKVWDFWVGESIGKTKCPCCKLTDITQMNFSCGHIIAESQGGGLTVQNLRPICGSCNSSMGIQNMNDFIRQYGL
jgi:hypothetical protein